MHDVSKPQLSILEEGDKAPKSNACVSQGVALLCHCFERYSFGQHLPGDFPSCRIFLNARRICNINFPGHNDSKSQNDLILVFLCHFFDNLGDGAFEDKLSTLTLEKAE
jgi:hypothetical protein